MRMIYVEQVWLEKLEDYLQADERFVPKDDTADLILLTPTGKRLQFRAVPKDSAP